MLKKITYFVLVCIALSSCAEPVEYPLYSLTTIE